MKNLKHKIISLMSIGLLAGNILSVQASSIFYNGNAINFETTDVYGVKINTTDSIKLQYIVDTIHILPQNIQNYIKDKKLEIILTDVENIESLLYFTDDGIMHKSQNFVIGGLFSTDELWAAYWENENIINLSNNIPENQITYTFLHEMGHFIDDSFDNISNNLTELEIQTIGKLDEKWNNRGNFDHILSSKSEAFAECFLIYILDRNEVLNVLPELCMFFDEIYIDSVTSIQEPELYQESTITKNDYFQTKIYKNYNYKLCEPVNFYRFAQNLIHYPSLI